MERVRLLLALLGRWSRLVVYELLVPHNRSFVEGGNHSSWFAFHRTPGNTGSVGTVSFKEMTTNDFTLLRQYLRSWSFMLQALDFTSPSWKVPGSRNEPSDFYGLITDEETGGTISSYIDHPFPHGEPFVLKLTMCLAPH